MEVKNYCNGSAVYSYISQPSNQGWSLLHEVLIPRIGHHPMHDHYSGLFSVLQIIKDHTAPLGHPSTGGEPVRYHTRTNCHRLGGGWHLGEAIAETGDWGWLLRTPQYLPPPGAEHHPPQSTHKNIRFCGTQKRRWAFSTDPSTNNFFTLSLFNFFTKKTGECPFFLFLFRCGFFYRFFRCNLFGRRLLGRGLFCRRILFGRLAVIL